VRLGVLIVAVGACMLLAASALAQQPPAPSPAPSGAARATPAVPPAEPTPEQREAAREAYTRGQALFTENKFAEAKAAFEQAHAAVPNPVVLLSLAECDMRLGNLEAAHEALDRYQRERPDAPDRAEVQRKIDDLLATPATLVLTSEPQGASVRVDGKDTGKTTPAEVPVPRGEHQVELTLAGHKPATTPVTARIGARHELHVALQPEPPKEVPAPITTDISTREGSPTAALWITGIVGAAGIVTGTVLGFMVLAERSDFDAEPTSDSADRGERLALFTDVAFGVGAMALLTGAVIYITSDGDAEPEPTAARRAPTALRLELTPSASTRGAALVARTRF